MSDSVSSSSASSALEDPGGGSTLSDRVRSLRLQENHHSPSSSTLPWVLCGVFALSTLGLGYRQFLTPEAAEVAAASEIDPNILETPANTEAPSPGNAPLVGKAQVAASGGVALESKGYIIPEHQILVSPKVSGMVMELFIEEGQRVKQGEVLAVLEHVDYAADLSRAEAVLAASRQQLLELETGFRPEEIEQSKAELQEAEAQLVQLKSEYARNERLKESNSLAARDFDVAKANFIAMERKVDRLRNAYDLIVKGPRKERIELAKAEVQQAEADLTKSRWRLDNCTIRAPVSGTILRKNAEEGNIVNPIAFNGSYSLCELADLSDLEVELSIQERDVSRVFKGQRCKVRSDAYPDRIYEGVVSRLMPIADRAKGAVPVRVKLTVPTEEEGVYLKPEMGAVVSFLSQQEVGKGATAEGPNSAKVEEPKAP